MNFLGNIIWFICGGEIIGMVWLVFGLLWCATIVGIPVGLQCIKISGVVFFPYGREIECDDDVGTVKKTVWMISSGVFITSVSLIIGCILCASVIGIPFGMQCFKIAKIALTPFGAKVY